MTTETQRMLQIVVECVDDAQRIANRPGGFNLYDFSQQLIHFLGAASDREAARTAGPVPKVDGHGHGHSLECAIRQNPDRFGVRCTCSRNAAPAPKVGETFSCARGCMSLAECIDPCECPWVPTPAPADTTAPTNVVHISAGAKREAPPRGRWLLSVSVYEPVDMSHPDPAYHLSSAEITAFNDQDGREARERLEKWIGSLSEICEIFARNFKAFATTGPAQPVSEPETAEAQATPVHDETHKLGASRLKDGARYCVVCKTWINTETAAVAVTTPESGRAGDEAGRKPGKGPSPASPSAAMTGEARPTVGEILDKAAARIAIKVDEIFATPSVPDNGLPFDIEDVRGIVGEDVWRAVERWGEPGRRGAILTHIVNRIQVTRPPQATVVGDAVKSASETWAYIERLLVDECGFLTDQGLASQRPNMIAAIANGRVGEALLKAAADFLSVPSLAKVRVSGVLMDRDEVAAALTSSATGEVWRTLYDRLIAEFRRHRSTASPSTGWLPIKDAPKDGTPILARCQPLYQETDKPMNFTYIAVVWWRGEKFKDSRWQWRIAFNDSAAEPTHYQPLPEPPK